METPFNTDKVLCVKIDNTLKSKDVKHLERHENIYECTRKYWHVDIERARKADYVMGIANGIVQAVYIPQKWAITTNPKFAGRYEFEGEEVEDYPYIGMNIAPFVKGHSPIRYFNM